MAKEIRTTFTDPIELPGIDTLTFGFKICSNVFPDFSVNVEADAIRKLARKRGVRGEFKSHEGLLEELRRFQPEFVELAQELWGGRDHITITMGDIR